MNRMLAQPLAAVFRATRTLAPAVPRPSEIRNQKYIICPLMALLILSIAFSDRLPAPNRRAGDGRAARGRKLRRLAGRRRRELAADV